MNMNSAAGTVLETEFDKDTTLRIWFSTASTSRSIPYAKTIKKHDNVLLVETHDNKQFLFNFDNINCIETES
jgi:hypothetical protein